MVAGWLVAIAGAVEAAPLEAYGKLPTIEAVAVSPSGRYVAVVTTQGKAHELSFLEVATGRSASKGEVAAPDVKVLGLRWAGDMHLLMSTTMTGRLFYAGEGRHEYLICYNLDLATMKLSQLVDPSDRHMNALAAMPTVRTVNGKSTIFAQIGMISSTGSLGLFRIDPQTQAMDLVERGEEDTNDWVVDGSGQVVGQELYDGKTGNWRIKLRAGGGWREAAAVTSLGERPYTLGLGRDGKSVLYADFADGGWSWREARLDPAAADGNVVLRGDPSPIFDPRDGHLIGDRSLDGDEVRYSFYEPADRAMWTAVSKAFKGNLVHLVSWSDDRRQVVVLADSPTEGPAYAVIDLDTRKATWLGPQYAELTEADISPRKAVAFKARDGLALSGYLTLPAGKTAKGLPLIVFPHGGPASRDEPGFDWWAQAMASRGYAVLQVNFRGSDGLGEPLLEAGYGQWGRKMQTDLSDGVRWLAAEGTIDAKRVCIVGGSYGGYAALAGAALDGDVYRCAVSVAGLADLRRFIAWSTDQHGQAAYRYWTRFMGVRDGHDPALPQISPIEHVDQIHVPILMIHGKDDTVVPLEQSELMAAALSKAGKPVELVVQKGGDHWLTRSETRLQMLTATTAFLEKNNPPN